MVRLGDGGGGVMESWGRERFPAPTPEELLPVPAGPRSPPLSPGCATTRFSLPALSRSKPGREVEGGKRGAPGGGSGPGIWGRGVSKFAALGVGLVGLGDNTPLPP